MPWEEFQDGDPKMVFKSNDVDKRHGHLCAVRLVGCS